jgi:hypothetical protein
LRPGGAGLFGVVEELSEILCAMLRAFDAGVVTVVGHSEFRFLGSTGAERNSGAVFGNQLQFLRPRFSVFNFPDADGILLPMRTEP